MTESKKENPDFKCVVAIDVGTSGSGACICFQNDSDKFYSVIPGKHQVAKIKTCFILDRETKELVAFGDAAWEKYGNQPGKYFFFKQFKMQLYRANRILRDNPMVTSVCGGCQITAAAAFGFVFQQFRQWTEKLLTNFPMFKMDDIAWMITVPAIWSEGAKQIMMSAAAKGGIPNAENRLFVCLEPTAGSLWAQRIIARNSANLEGTVCLTVDAGGGTIDTMLYKITGKNSLEKICSESGGNWGSTFIDEEFEQMLEQFFGQQIRIFRKERPAEYEQIMKEFEKRKEQFDPREEEDSNILLYSFVRFLDKARIDINDLISEHDDSTTGLRYEADALVIPPNIFARLFQKQIDYVIKHLKQTVSDHKTQVRYINMVGGFSTSEMLLQAVKKEFEIPEQLTVILPPHAGEAIVCGAAWSVCV